MSQRASVAHVFERRAWRLAAPLLSACVALVAPLQGALAAAEKPSHVRVVQTDGRYQLLVDGVPFRVEGAGFEHGDQQALAARGGNAFRTWRTDNGRESGRAMLDRAQRHGLRVAMGLALTPERHGFDYDDARAVARQREHLRREVLALKDHPALLLWVVGNELNLESRNPAVWDAVNQIAEMIHDIDPNHPVTTTLAGFDAALIEQIRTRAGALDLLGFQLYGDLRHLPKMLRDSGWTGPYLVTEWGPTGHWESPLTAWGAPLEDHATRKAELLLQRYREVIDADRRQCLGSFVFLWGQKQERTPTWYGLFLASGESTPSVDAMQRAWTGQWPANRSPVVSPLRIDDAEHAQGVRLRAGREYEARIDAHDPERDPLHYRWSLLEESRARTVGGDPESVPRGIAVRFTPLGAGAARFVAPRRAGHYRLFVTVHDGQGHAGYANLPFAVEAAPR